ncbi:MAG: hypothetical protein GKR94_30695 [Gammaproteobacteria bacterium]|nr:hypothetical protein [Gammaproteobacteria bacterium]
MRGRDEYGHFELEATGERPDECVALHERIGDIQAKIYLDDTERAGIGGLRETNTFHNTA